MSTSRFFRLSRASMRRAESRRDDCLRQRSESVTSAGSRWCAKHPARYRLLLHGAENYRRINLGNVHVNALQRRPLPMMKVISRGLVTPLQRQFAQGKGSFKHHLDESVAYPSHMCWKWSFVRGLDRPMRSRDRAGAWRRLAAKERRTSNHGTGHPRETGNQ